MPQKGLIVLVFVCLAMDDLDNLRIEGSVRDELNRPIPNASIEVRATNAGTVRTSTSGSHGLFRIPALPPGEYAITVEAHGFRKTIISKLNGVSGTTLRCDIVLEPAIIEASITISASSDTESVDTTRTYNGGTVSKVLIENLPLETRNPFELFYILPGIGAPAYDTRYLAEGDPVDHFLDPPEEVGTVSLQGGTSYSNNFTIDGLDNNDDRAARERFNPSPDSVEEVQVITNQFAAEYGRASGGRINIRLRGGTNDLRGSASFFLRDARLNANSFFRNADPLRGFRLPLNEKSLTAAIGGPILKDRLLFFSAFQHDFERDTASISALVPVTPNPKFHLPAPNGANLGHLRANAQGGTVVNGGADVGLYDLDLSTPRQSDSIQTRLDIHPNSHHSLFANLTLARQSDQRSFAGGRRTRDTIRSKGRSSYSVAFSDTFAKTDRVINELRAQFSNLIPQDGPVSSRPVVIIEIEDPRDSGSTSDSMSRSGNLLSGSSNLGANSRKETRWQVNDIANFFFARISIRSGFDIQFVQSEFNNLEDTTGTYYFSSPADFLTGTGDRFRQRFNTRSNLTNLYTGVFLQTDYRMTSSLSISGGIRWDRESIIRDNNNAAVRSAVVWAPGTDPRTVVRAGFGVFFNRALLRTLDDFKLTTHSMLIDTNLPAHSSLLPSLDFPRGISGNHEIISSLAIKETSFLRKLEPALRIPESYQVSIGFERALKKGFKFELSYVFNRGAHLWRESNTNAPQLSLISEATFADYLTSRDFNNHRDPLTGERPITPTGNADIVRFDRSEAISRVIQDMGRRIVIFGLANQSTSNSTSALKAALAAIRNLRPVPALEQIEELHSNGSSFYHGVSVEGVRNFGRRGSLRASYTLSRLIDDGVVNTSSPLVKGDLKRERALSLQDSRHRFAFSGYGIVAGTTVAFVLLANSPRPFNIGINGNDRNLDDVNNDRPNAVGGMAHLSLPVIGTSGDLARNAGRGPWQHTLNVRISRTFAISERLRVSPIIEAFNPLNTTVFSYGAEYVDWNNLAPRRTIKPRTLRVGLKLEF